VGKTTLARIMADSFNAEFIALSAVLSGVKDIREAVERAVIGQALEQCGGAVAVAADRLQLGKATLYEKIKRYGIVVKGDSSER